MEKQGELFKIKVLISGKSQSYPIYVSRQMKLSELSIFLCEKFELKLEDIKIILNNKPLNRYKDEFLATVISKDKKSYIIIYFNESKSK